MHRVKGGRMAETLNVVKRGYKGPRTRTVRQTLCKLKQRLEQDGQPGPVGYTRIGPFLAIHRPHDLLAQLRLLVHEAVMDVVAPRHWTQSLQRDGKLWANAKRLEIGEGPGRLRL
jgi:hypothetical protein